jgi:hypothetical protein
MTNKLRSSVCILALLACVISTASDLKPASAKSDRWKAYWSSVGVTPPPPKDFLDVNFHGRIDNFTNGQISDETARKWVLANLRRGTGDGYAAMNLREDIANAGVFGPPGLNGTDRSIRAMRDKGVERIESSSTPNIVAVAVISIPKDVQADNPHAGLTDYVIVLLYRSTPDQATLVYRDGRREVLESKSEGELHWQLDTGHYFEHATLGPLWYQKNGWSCQPDDTLIGKLCGRVKP